MANAWFGWCPHGDQRWNLRFLELLTAGTVPVVVADGLTLPFEMVREWERFNFGVGWGEGEGCMHVEM